MNLYLIFLLFLAVYSSGLEVQKEKITHIRGENVPVELKVMTFNIWQEGTMVDNGLDKIGQVILETNPDIIGFTEVRNYDGVDWTSRIIKTLADKGRDYHGMFIGGDVSVLSKYPITASKLIVAGEGSIASFDMQLDDRSIVVAVAHLDYTGYACYLPRGYYGGTPNWELIKDQQGHKTPIINRDAILAYNATSERVAQIKTFLEAVKDETRPIVLMGDFNEPSHLDWTKNTVHRFDHNGVVINWPTTHLLFRNDFVDAYRQYFPDELTHPGITWPSYAHGKGTTSWTPFADERDRIDYIFYKGKGITTTYATLVGPKASYAYDEVVLTYTDEEHFMADTLDWPSDHKAVMVILNFE